MIKEQVSLFTSTYSIQFFYSIKTIIMNGTRVTSYMNYLHTVYIQTVHLDHHFYEEQTISHTSTLWIDNKGV